MRRSESHPFEATPSELALRGEGTTALSLAVRLRAPRATLQALVKSCIEQVGVVQRRGSILIEAIRHRASDDVLAFLLKAVIHHQSTTNNRIDVLGARDDLGRTALHYMVERVKGAWERGEQNACSRCVFRDLLQARPESVQTLDSDGNTPLVLLLLLPRVPDQQNYSGVEEDILHMVQLMVASCPGVAAMSRRLPEPWHSAKQDTSSCHGASMDGSPTPLYYAILHGRSLGTVNALLEANQKVGINACATVISPYHEIPLHTAICTQASMPIISRLVQECPESVLCADVNGLTALDWMWIRHVVDWHTNNTPHTLVSRGRYLAGRFLEWHHDVSREMSRPNKALNNASSPAALPFTAQPLAMKEVTRDLISRMELLLPTAAIAASPEHVCKSWSLLHVTCYVPCPLAMVHLALEHTDNTVLQARDFQQRLPLHWAAARFGYTANFPVGVSRTTKRLAENTPVPALVSKFEPACTARDCHGQLPLHIAIDAARHYRRLSNATSSVSRLKTREVDAMEDEILNALISSYPESLESIDGKSGLLPFQQAAVGDGARLNTIYVLFRLLPALIRDSSRAPALDFDY